MDLRHFFEGQQSKENAASAWLATLLDYSQSFRAAFFADVDSSLDPLSPWTVAVETQLDGPCDVTLEADETFVFIENKIAASAKRQGQFVRYYQGAVQAHPTKRLVGVYLGPSPDVGDDERAAVTTSMVFSRRAMRPLSDLVVGMGWKVEMPRLVESVVGEYAWFATSGLQAIQDHMQKLEKGRPFNAQREVLRRIVAAAMKRLGASAGGLKLARWPSIGYEAIYTVKSPLTVFLNLHYDEDEEHPYELHGVVVDGIVKVQVGVSIGLSRSGRANPALVEGWRRLLDGGVVTVDGLGEISIANRKSVAFQRNFEGSAADLEELLVTYGGAALAFVTPYVEAKS